jgi:hypothetical protein
MNVGSSSTGCHEGPDIPVSSGLRAQKKLTADGGISQFIGVVFYQLHVLAALSEVQVVPPENVMFDL